MDSKNEIISGCIPILHYFHNEIYLFFAIHEADIHSSIILSSQSQSPPLLHLRSTNVDRAPNIYQPCALGELKDDDRALTLKLTSHVL